MRHFLAAMLVAGVGGPVQAQTSSNPSEFLQLSGERQSAYVEGVVCTENLNPDVVVMKSAKDRV